jgi:hypothetical protein
LSRGIDLSPVGLGERQPAAIDMRKPFALARKG